MSALAQTIVSPVQSNGARSRLRLLDSAVDVAERVPFEHEAVLELATADDVAAGMARVLALTRRVTGAARVEWWAPGDDGAHELVAAAGDGRGPRRVVPLGRVGSFAVLGGSLEPRLASALTALAPIIRRRGAEEQLARAAIQLAQRNEALEDFAALVAHELKTPLQAALLAGDQSSSLEQALDLVDALLQAAQNEASERTFASVADCLEQAVHDLRVADAEISAGLTTALPIQPASLRVILRNLLANAVAAKARHIHVASVQSARSWRLLVDDDGVGLADVDGYAAGSGLGLSLCRRIAARFGGVLELAPRPSGGTRATLVLGETL